MVEFWDPVQQKQMSYHLDKKIQAILDKVRDGGLAKKDEDRVYLVDGRERSGKSTFTFQLAKYVDPTFNLSRVVFSPEDFLKAVRTADKGQVIVFDEAFRGLSSRGALSKINKAIIQAMMEMGQRNLIIFIVLPTFFLLELYAAVLRSEALFHVYRSKDGQRAFRVYNYKKKAILYMVGKKRGLDYRFPKTRFKGRFFPIYAIDEPSYREKKRISFESLGDKAVEEENKYMIQRDKIIVAIKKHLNLSEDKLSEWLATAGVELSGPTIGVIDRKYRDIG